MDFQLATHFIKANYPTELKLENTNAMQLATITRATSIYPYAEGSFILLNTQRRRIG